MESDAERLARELFSPEGDARRAREKEETDRTIQAAISDASVRKVMQDTRLEETHIRDLHRRLFMFGDERIAARGIRDPKLLRWFARNGGLQMRLDRDQAILLGVFAKTGRLDENA